MALSANNADSNTATGVCNGAAVPCATCQLTGCPTSQTGPGLDHFAQGGARVPSRAVQRGWAGHPLHQDVPDGLQTRSTRAQPAFRRFRRCDQQHQSHVRPQGGVRQHPELCAKACLGEWWARRATHSWEYRICDAADMDAVIQSRYDVNNDFTLADPSKSDASTRVLPLRACLIEPARGAHRRRHGGAAQLEDSSRGCSLADG